MTTSDDIPDDLDSLAGEYVLGTLDAAERETVDARRQREPALERAISEWQRRLAPLDRLTPDVAPPPGVFGQIEQRLKATTATVVSLADLQAARASAKRWRATAVAASMAAAGLIGVLSWREATRVNEQQTFLGVFATDDVLPKFYLTIDLKTRQLTVRPVDAQQQPGKTYQLWIASDQLGPAPQSLGLMDDGFSTTTKSLGAFDPAMLRQATFGVSLEPAGGSPTGRPTAPALHAKLLPVARP